MRLKSIKLAGFKSFVDITKVELPSTITAVVGPNGCGKSNIIDAVRWVMGEISAKQLRGESMSDVIFNGSTQRTPLAQAAIELHFDNTYGRLGGEYQTYNEITIRRQVSRDGQSNYYLNGTRCRRKDITNVFLGTGLGSRSYAIIEQGMISRLIEAKPEELRVFLEEAAGISRYKERRKETEQRLGHTHDNLSRINDVREELYKQISHLEHQAKTAEKYKQLKSNERSLRAQLFVLRYQELQRKFEEIKIQLAQLQTNIQRDENNHRALTETLQQQFDSQRQFQKNLEQAQHEYAELNAAIRVCEQSIHYNQHQQQQFEFEFKQNLQQQKEIEHLNTLDHSSLEQLSLDLEHIKKALQDNEKLFEERKNQHHCASEQQRIWQSQWQEMNRNLAENSQIVEVEQTRLQQMEVRLQQIKQQSEKLTQEKNQLDTKEETSTLDATLASLIELENKRTIAQEKLVSQETDLKSSRDMITIQSKQVNELRQQTQQLAGKLSALHTLQQIALGYQQEKLQLWLKANGFENTERLANLIEVEPGYEVYLENYLGEKLQAITLENFASLHALKKSLPDGNVEFIKMDPPICGNNRGIISGLAASLLVQKIKGPQALLEKLSQVYFAPTVQEALMLLPILPKNAEIITQENVLIGHHWVQIRRSRDEQSGLLQRKREIAALESTLEEQKNRLKDFELQLQIQESNLQETESTRQSFQIDCQQLEQTWNQQQAEIQIQRSRIEQKQSRLKTVEQELDTQIQEMQKLESQYQISRELWQETAQVLNELNRLKDELISQQQPIETMLIEANQNLQETDTVLQQLRIKEQRCSTEQHSLILQQERTKIQCQQLEARQHYLQQQLSELKPILSEFEEELLKHKEKQNTCELKLEVAKTNLTEVEQKLRDIESERQSTSQNLEQLRQQFSNYQIQAEHTQTKCTSILEQFQTLNLPFEEVVAHLSADASENNIEHQLEEVQQHIEHLGAVNLAAISELEKQTERKCFMDNQYQDLVDALSALGAALQEIDQETKSKFEETFNAVNQNFQSLFPKVFGGGNAYLSITSENLLEAGVTVFAQPPGKRNSSIHLLSGGEKALTALALVFAIFELHPAPFCMLDEVDAPLDDVNVERFCNLVKAMSDKTQFIVVTHNKVAMEMADYLMGITMQEPGVSRLVAVDVEAAIAMAAQAA